MVDFRGPSEGLIGLGGELGTSRVGCRGEDGMVLNRRFVASIGVGLVDVVVPGLLASLGVIGVLEVVGREVVVGGFRSVTATLRAGVAPGRMDDLAVGFLASLADFVEARDL